jgi:hypothetical protein
MSGKRKARYHPYKKNKTPNLRQQVVPPRGGLLFPGHDFLGPFNPLDYATPRNEADVHAKEHDIEYNNIGSEAYYKFTPGDQKLIEALADNPSAGARAAKFFFRTKRYVAHAYNTRASKQQKISEHFKVQKNVGQRLRKVGPSQTQREANNEKQGTLYNLQATTQTAMGDDPMNGGAKSKGAHETPVDDIVYVERGIPDYTFASLPYVRIANFKGDNLFADDNGFRMTSPYDCFVGVTQADLNTGAGTAFVNQLVSDATDTSAQKARWWDYYASMYKYYHVVSARWKMLFENQGLEPLWVHEMYISAENPPSGATNQDILHWKGVQSHYLRPMAVGTSVTGINNTQLSSGAQGENDPGTAVVNFPNFESGNMVNNVGSNIIQLAGEYKQGDFTRDIKQDAEVETWTETSTNPTFAERLLIRVKPENEGIQTNSTGVFGRTIKWRYHLQIEYLVEFKELKDGLKWPVTNQPCELTISTNINTDGT